MENTEQLKKEYQNQYEERRKENLINLRINIDKEDNQTNFAKKLGFTKEWLSKLEHGDKDLSLGNCLAYKKYFKEVHNLDISFDYLFGFTSYLENKAVSIEEDIGLCQRAADTLKRINIYNSSINLNSFLNKFLSNERVFLKILANLREYVYGHLFTTYYKIDNELVNEANLEYLDFDKVFFRFDTPGESKDGYFRLYKEEFFQFRALQNISGILPELKESILLEDFANGTKEC